MHRPRHPEEPARNARDGDQGRPVRRRSGGRPVYAGEEPFSSDPHWRDLVSFCEYFDGDTGKGLGAQHQTGWTGLVAKLLQRRH